MVLKTAACNPDIDRERKKCTFNVQELTTFLDRGENKTQERKALGNYYSLAMYNLVILMGDNGDVYLNSFFHC